MHCYVNIDKQILTNAIPPLFAIIIIVSGFVFFFWNRLEVVLPSVQVLHRTHFYWIIFHDIIIISVCWKISFTFHIIWPRSKITNVTELQKWLPPHTHTPPFYQPILRDMQFCICIWYVSLPWIRYQLTNQPNEAFRFAPISPFVDILAFVSVHVLCRCRRRCRGSGLYLLTSLRRSIST